MKKAIFAWAGLVFLFAPLGTASAGLVITNANISGGHYVYDLTYAEMGSNTVFSNDVYSTTNAYAEFLYGAAYVTGPRGGNFAQFVYKFDFSGTKYVPTRLDLRDRLVIFKTEDPNEHSHLTSAWSIDNVAYTTLHFLDSHTYSPPVGDTGAVTYAINLPARPPAVYFRVTFENFDANGFSLCATEWNRQMSSETTHFRADFTMEIPPVPEPASLVLLGLGCAAVLVRRKAPRQ